MDPETVDLNLISTSPVEGTLYLIGLRRAAIYNHFKRFHENARKMNEKPLLGPLVKQMFTPVHPLLLSTAISVSIVRHCDYSSFLHHYASGMVIPGLEATLLNLKEFGDEDELNKILNLEWEFVNAFTDHGVELLVGAGKLIPVGKKPTMLDVYWGAWLATNPVYRGENLQQGWVEAIRYSNDMNQDIHNAREHCEYHLNCINKDLNLALSVRPSNKELVSRMGRKQANATLLVERARRFYTWAAHELNAWSHELDLLFQLYKTEAELIQFSAVVDSVLKETGTPRQNYTQYLLPDAIRKRLRVQPET